MSNLLLDVCAEFGSALSMFFSPPRLHLFRMVAKHVQHVCTGTRSLHSSIALLLRPMFPTMSDTSYPDEALVAGSYESGESRTQTVFAGRDGGWGDTCTMQSMSG